jgi:iron complex outermembrane receptor protein
MLHKAILLCFTFVVFLINSTAQPCNNVLTLHITGNNGVHLEQATVTVNSQLIKSDKDKNFTTKLCNGNAKISITNIGYSAFDTTINITSTKRINIALLPTIESLKEVLVNSVSAYQNLPTSQIKATQKVSLIGLNLAQALQQANGVTLLSSGPTVSKPMIHGFHSNRILILNNGVRQEGQNWGTEHAPEIDPFTADKFTIIKGAASVKYGAEALGGVVLVEPKPMFEKLGFSGSLNTMYYSNNRMGVVSGLVTYVSSNNHWAFRLQGTVKKAGNVKTPNYYIANTGLREINAAATIAYQKNNYQANLYVSNFSTTLGFYTGAHVESKDDLEAAIKSNSPLFTDGFTYLINRPKQTVNHTLIKLTQKLQLKNNHQLQLITAHQENSRDEYDSKQYLNQPEMSLSLGTTNADFLLKSNFSKNFNTEFGVQYSVQQNINKENSVRIFIPNYQLNSIGIYALANVNVHSTNLSFGIRYDSKQFDAFKRELGIQTNIKRNFNNLTATVQAAYKIANNIQGKSIVATAFRPPAVNELFANGLHQGLASIEVGNPLFNAEQNLSFTQEMMYKPDSNFKFEITAYSNHISNYIYLQPVQPPSFTIRGYYPTFNYVATNAHVYGFDVSLQYNFRKQWQVSSKTSIVRGWNKTSSDWIILMPADRASIELNFLPSNNKTFNQNLLGIEVTHVKQQTLVPTNTSVLQDYAPPPSAYTLLNLNTQTTIKIYKKPVQIGCTIFNILNTKFRDYLNRFRYFIDEIGLNASVRLSYNF